MSAVRPFSERLRQEAPLELGPWPTDGPQLTVEKGCYPDGSPGPQLRGRRAREGWTWIGDLRGSGRAAA